MDPFEQAVVVVPAHNEIAHLPECLRSLTTAALCLPAPTLVVVVLDSSNDGSDLLAGEYGPDVHFVSIDAGNVGTARAAGYSYARSTLTGVDPERTWYAATDADSTVPADWLVRMTSEGPADTDMVLGVVRVPTWRNFRSDVMRRYTRAYQSKGKTHNHIHGANMGFRADAYWRLGGFRDLETGEDVDLVRRFEADGMSIHRDSGLSVATSDRRVGRAPGGFADHLRQMADSVRPRRADVP